ncbi:MAG TPA: uroporphyrinogen decarboxylase family protein [Anaeromyxobacter sp.]|nr:uroporphyrinogen decarboxylase family protein [Anaeromyxobacter sp.]
MNGRERILATMRGQPTDGRLPLIPISMMIAAKHVGERYGAYIHDARVHARGQLAFAEAWEVNHVSAISCPTTEAADLGANVIYYEDQPPAIDEREALLSDKRRLRSLRPIAPGRRMTKRLETLRLLREGVAGARLVEGWVEGPTAESCDLRGINTFMIDLFEDPPFVQDLMAFVFENAMAFARLQLEAGAEIMGVGDAASSLVGPDLYREHVWGWQKRYVSALHEMGLLVRLHICGNTSPLLSMLREVPADILDLDSMVSVEEARRAVGPERLLSGNIDPVRVLCHAPPAAVREALQGCWEAAGRSRYAVNAGCEIPRDTPPENLAAMRDFARAPLGSS